MPPSLATLAALVNYRIDRAQTGARLRVPQGPADRVGNCKQEEHKGRQQQTALNAPNAGLHRGLRHNFPKVRIFAIAALTLRNARSLLARQAAKMAQPRHVLIINGNPDPSAGRLTDALARAYAEGTEKSGCVVNQIRIGALEFPLLRQSTDFLAPPTDPAIVAARAQILCADHLVFVYPLWLGGPPALLKAFMEQVSRAGFALTTGDGGFPKGALKGRSARVVVTMGMPSLIYRFYYGAHGVRAFNRSILGMAGIKPIRTTYFGSIGSPLARVSSMTAKMRALGQSVA